MHEPHVPRPAATTAAAAPWRRGRAVCEEDGCAVRGGEVRAQLQDAHVRAVVSGQRILLIQHQHLA